ncbi:hypothetical protein ACS0TY_036095 [Phlomoides rotata]
MTDYKQEQDMEIEALEAILMDDFKEIPSSESGLNTSNRCFQITICPQDDEADESNIPLVRLALIFSHTERYPDEPPLVSVKSLKAIPMGDLKVLKEKLDQEAEENLGMAMVYTLVGSAKEWLSERFSQDVEDDSNEEAEAAKDEVFLLCDFIVSSGGYCVFKGCLFQKLYLNTCILSCDSAFCIKKYVKVLHCPDVIIVLLRFSLFYHSKFVSANSTE